ncbi:MAG TPA: CDGSH iron-sulfur domain-containing protein [Thiothrix sp.]|nr:CDGSH iron-sulfur domain-containing protein [Thiothrix sp.]
MSEPVIAKKAPCPVTLEAGKTYWWCTCGKSASQPFCDGAHQGTDFIPLKVEVDDTRKYGLCGCKHSKNGAFCDGAHRNL